MEDTPTVTVTELLEEVQDKPWAQSQRAAKTAITISQSRDDGVPMGDDEDVKTLIKEDLPAHSKEELDPAGDRPTEELEGALVQDFTETLLANQSPEAQSRIADYRLDAIFAIENLVQAGVLPHIDIGAAAAIIESIPVYIYSEHHYGPLSGKAAAFYSPSKKLVAIIQEGRLNKRRFIHEMIHAAIEESSMHFGSVSASMREATVEHLAQVSRGSAIGEGSNPLSTGGVKEGLWLRRKVHKESLTEGSDSYISERLIMYELCEGAIGMEDFIAALTDPSGEDLIVLQDKLTHLFGDLLATEVSEGSVDVLKWIEDRISGPNAQELTGGLENRQDRVEWVLAEIKQRKGQRSVAQAIKSRIASRVKYAETRRAA